MAVVPSTGENLTNLLKRFETGYVISDHIDKYPGSLNDVDESQKTVLMWAAENGRTDVVMRALDYHVKLDAVDHDGWTAVMYAARRCSLPVMKMLLDAGCDPNLATYEDKFTALHLAAGNENIDICKILILSGADPNLVDIDGRPACYYLKTPKNKKILSDIMDFSYHEGITKSEIDSRNIRAYREHELSLSLENPSSSNSSYHLKNTRIENALTFVSSDVAMSYAQTLESY